MISLNADKLAKALDNSIKYSIGFLQEIEALRAKFNQSLGVIIVEELEGYIDVQARLYPETLHHIYEWGHVGDPSSRLISFTSSADQNNILIKGTFLDSRSASSDGGEPFVNKARVMESGVAITIAPKSSDVLAFMADGEMIFTSSEVTVLHPGGPDVAGSLEETINSFLRTFVTAEIIAPLVADMSNPKEFAILFPGGVRSGLSAGRAAARRYMSPRRLK